MFEFRDAFDISSVEPDALFPDEDVPEFRATFTRLLDPWKKLAERVFV